MCNSGVLVAQVWSTFDIPSFKVIFYSFGALDSKLVRVTQCNICAMFTIILPTCTAVVKQNVNVNGHHVFLFRSFYFVFAVFFSLVPFFIPSLFSSYHSLSLTWIPHHLFFLPHFHPNRFKVTQLAHLHVIFRLFKYPQTTWCTGPRAPSLPWRLRS